MKRHAALRQLSSDHHSGLVLARRVSKLAADSDLRGAAQNLLTAWRTEIGPHFVAEEEWLLPLFARYSAPDHPLIVETLRQHVHMRALIDEIEEGLVAPSLPLLQALAAALREHIRFEENDLFPAIEAALPETQLQRLLKHFAPL
ncbi:hemerythrin domain-containing protein [Sulfurivermis fontis]|uniref:hemerythrin domain-containing protein n=1 Tax=Sulfurivermis fontis TaxID=1972068 RepID=UPI001558D3EB|nr:hemerythrin domain-containing protein [Sulfurivermis fontis]